jgi:N-acetylglutamate synthase-like GNAT family acetyltransferase
MPSSKEHPSLASLNPQGTVSHSLEEQMLDALELFKYSYSFRNSLFVILVDNQESLKSLITDFQVIQSSRIFLVVLVPFSSGLKDKIASYCERGVQIEYFTHAIEKDVSKNKHQSIKKEFSSNDLVVIGLDGMDEDSLDTAKKSLTKAFKIADSYHAKKFFYLHKDGGLLRKGELLSHISLSDLKKNASQTPSEFNLSPELVKIIVNDMESTKREFVIIDDSPGALFQEIFTHQGRGTLITDEYPNQIRKGTPKDTFMVSRLMKPYIHAGILLPLSEHELTNQIEDFLLYTINESIVAGARMKEHGEGAELAKFFCLPRFRRRGHARTLAEAFIENARALNKKFIFSLSVSPGMWDFLKTLEFSEIERELLPESWKESYNFQRKSKAFLRKL